jgi:hypothetical protein
VEETGVPVENHRPATSHWQTLSYNAVSNRLRLIGIHTYGVVCKDQSKGTHICSHIKPSKGDNLLTCVSISYTFNPSIIDIVFIIMDMTLTCEFSTLLLNIKEINTWVLVIEFYCQYLKGRYPSQMSLDCFGISGLFNPFYFATLIWSPVRE